MINGLCGLELMQNGGLNDNDVHPRTGGWPGAVALLLDPFGSLQPAATWPQSICITNDVHQKENTDAISTN